MPNYTASLQCSTAKYPCSAKLRKIQSIQSIPVAPERRVSYQCSTSVSQQCLNAGPAVPDRTEVCLAQLQKIIHFCATPVSLPRPTPTADYPYSAEPQKSLGSKILIIFWGIERNLTGFTTKKTTQTIPAVPNPEYSRSSPAVPQSLAAVPNFAVFLKCPAPSTTMNNSSHKPPHHPNGSSWNAPLLCL